MSAPVRTALLQHYKQIAARWPKDKLRPETQLRDVLSKQIAVKSVPGTPMNEQAELRQLNAWYMLLDGHCEAKNRFRTGSRLLMPRENPMYYADVIKELEEAPTRSWFGRLKKRLGGMVRVK